MSATETKALVERLRELAADIAKREAFLKECGELGMDRRGLSQDLADYRAKVVVEMYDALPQILAALEPLTREPDADEVERPSMRIALELNAPRGIYTASKTRHAPLWQQYRADGYPIISTWIDEAGPGETQDHNDLWKRCINESQMCEAMVVYREADDVLKGAWLEMGVALGAGVPVFAVGCREFTIGKSGLLTHCDTVDEAMTRARAALTEEPGHDA